MEELNKLDNSQLIDLLAKHTSDYTKMISKNMMADEYEKCKLIIKAIQTEIDARRRAAGRRSENDRQERLAG